MLALTRGMINFEKKFEKLILPIIFYLFGLVTIMLITQDMTKRS